MDLNCYSRDGRGSALRDSKASTISREGVRHHNSAESMGSRFRSICHQLLELSGSRCARHSNILFPLTTPNARIRGTKASVRSPLVFHRIHLHAAFANMTAQFMGAPGGGLIEPVPATCMVTYCFLDHDQRNTLTTGAQLQVPWNPWFSTNVVHGSSVLAGDGPARLPPRATADVMFGKKVSERRSLGLTVLNISNSRFPFDINSSFEGTHFNNPREFIVSVRYRFHL